MVKVDQRPDCQMHRALIPDAVDHSLFEADTPSHGCSSIFLMIPPLSPLSLSTFPASEHQSNTELAPGFLLFLLSFLPARSYLP